MSPPGQGIRQLVDFWDEKLLFFLYHFWSYDQTLGFPLSVLSFVFAKTQFLEPYFALSYSLQTLNKS